MGFMKLLGLWEDTSDIHEVVARHDSRSFWEWVLLPYPRSFQDFQDAADQGIFVPSFWSSMAAMLAAAVAITIARNAFDKLIAIPLGKAFKVPSARPPLPDDNAALEDIYKAARGRPKDKHIKAGVAATKKSERYVQRWFRLRRAVNQPTTLNKFCEALWRFIFYTTSTIYGYVILKDKSWYNDTNFCWIGIGSQDISMDVRMYYYVEIGFYISLLYSLSTDTKRKDFYEMVIHHITTILLMGFSWLCGYYRIGTLILLVHDVADIFLEAAKTASYTKMQWLADVLFVVFAVVFGVSRLFYYPFWTIEAVAIRAINIMGLFPAWWGYMVLLCTLQVLHLFWFSIIARMAIKFLRAGKVEKDDRSEDELDQDLITGDADKKDE